MVHRAALGGRAGDASAHDTEVSAVREAARLIAEDERLTPVLVPLGDGLLAAAARLTPLRDTLPRADAISHS